MIVALSIGLIRSSEITSGLWILPRCPKVLIGYIYNIYIHHHAYFLILKYLSQYPSIQLSPVSKALKCQDHCILANPRSS